MSLYIGVCEDQQDEYRTFANLAHESGCPVTLEHFPDGGAFLSGYHPGKYDLIVLDIYMEGTDGLTTAQRIRESDNIVPIAFMTTSPDHALDGYRCHAARYLLKPLKADEIRELIEFAVREKAHQPGVRLRIDGQERFLPHRAITYIEQKNHNLEVHLEDGEVLTQRGRIDELPDENFPTPPFLRCHKSFLVNLMHVRALDEELLTFEMNSGEQVYIRRQSLRTSKEAYLKYMFAQTRSSAGAK